MPFKSWGLGGLMKMCGYQLRQTADAFSSPVTVGLLPGSLRNINLHECWGSRIGKGKVQTRAGLEGLPACDHCLYPLLRWVLCRSTTTALRSPKKSTKPGPSFPFLSHKPVRSFLVVYYTPYLYKIQRVLSTRPVGTVFILSPIPSWQWT